MVDSTCKNTKKKESYEIGKLRMMSIIEAELQIIFRILIECRLHNNVEKENLLCDE